MLCGDWILRGAGPSLKKEDMVRATEGVQSVLREDWSDDYANSDHWLKYWNAVSVASNDDWPEGMTENREKLFFKAKRLVPKSRVEHFFDHWHNSQLMHRDEINCRRTWSRRFSSLRVITQF